MNDLSTGGATAQQPPHDIEAERSLLGAILLDPSCMLRVLNTGLTPADFFLPTHRAIFAAMLRSYHAEVAVNPTSVAKQLREGLA